MAAMSAAQRHRQALLAVELEKELSKQKSEELTDAERADDQPSCGCPGSTPWLSRHPDRPWPDMPGLEDSEMRTCLACGHTQSRPKVTQ